MLGEVPLFSGLGKEELGSIADAGREVSFESGKTILQQGEPGLSFLLVLEGKVEIRKNGSTVATTGPGGFFGETTVFDDRPCSADVVAIEPTRCFGMTNWSFIPVVRSNPSIAIGIIKELVKRLRRLEETPSA
jgi:CRP/FNR family transcriptional regulator